MALTDDEKLDVARVREALNVPYHHSDEAVLRTYPQSMNLAKLAREGWKPEDPDLILARQVVGGLEWLSSMYRSGVLAGSYDNREYVKIALAAIKATKGT